jgi:hypothetical protein
VEDGEQMAPMEEEVMHYQQQQVDSSGAMIEDAPNFNNTGMMQGNPFSASGGQELMA